MRRLVVASANSGADVAVLDAFAVGPGAAAALIAATAGVAATADALDAPAEAGMSWKKASGIIGAAALATAVAEFAPSADLTPSCDFNDAICVGLITLCFETSDA